jgi:cytochrome c heme-lyase
LHMTDAGKCPVQRDHISPSTGSSNLESSGLSTDRETSSIPKSNKENWVYPSEAQFFAAMARKNHHPQAADMKTIVPMHNAVNERAWAEVMRWEAGKGGDACGGIKLVNFKGKPGEISPRARWKTFIGYGFNRLVFSVAHGSSCC